MIKIIFAAVLRQDSDYVLYVPDLQLVLDLSTDTLPSPEIQEEVADEARVRWYNNTLHISPKITVISTVKRHLRAHGKTLDDFLSIVSIPVTV